LRSASNETFTLRLLTGKLTRPADRLSLLPRRHFRWLLVESSSLHLPKDPLALHLFLERSESLVDIVIANEYLQGIIPFPNCLRRDAAVIGSDRQQFGRAAR
jgi:hypothetical protein